MSTQHVIGRGQLVAVIEERLRQADEGQFATDEQMRQLWAEFGLDPENGTRDDAN
jgi:hypothetical protein